MKTSEAISPRLGFQALFLFFCLLATSVMAQDFRSKTEPQQELQPPAYLMKFLGPDGQPIKKSSDAKKVSEKAAHEQLQVIERLGRQPRQALSELSKIAESQCVLLTQIYPQVMNADDVEECRRYARLQAEVAKALSDSEARGMLQILQLSLQVELGEKTVAQAQTEIARIMSEFQSN